MSMILDSFDHLVLTVDDIDRTVDFYTKVLGMEHEVFGNNRHALRFGTAKINLHERNHIFLPAANLPTPGSADLCLRTPLDVNEILASLNGSGVTVEEGPVSRTGALGSVTSVYIRDPDSNLIEIATYHPHI